MPLDWQARRSLELEVILENPVRMAREMLLHALYALLRSALSRRNEDKERMKDKRGMGVSFWAPMGPSRARCTV